MKWSLPRDAAQSSEYVGFPWECHPSEGEIRMALTAQYNSIYRCNYTGMPQGHNHRNNGEGRNAPRQSRREVPLSADTEMREKYRPPKQKPGLLWKSSPYSCTDPSMGCCGIVPTVVQRRAQQKRSHLTNYDRFCGKTDTNVPNMIKSLLSQELQHLNRTLPKEGEQHH
ncbi:tex26 [Pungitius sinensis]